MHLWLTVPLARHRPIVNQEAHVVNSVFKYVTALREFIKMKIQRIKYTEWGTAILNEQWLKVSLSSIIFHLDAKTSNINPREVIFTGK